MKANKLVRDLKKLASMLEKESLKLYAESENLYAKPETGNNDEDWTRVHRLHGRAAGLMRGAREIREILKNLSESNHPKKGSRSNS